MCAEHLLPLSARAVEAIGTQQAHLTQAQPAGSTWLFPSTSDLGLPVAYEALRRVFALWQQRIELHDEAGRPIHLAHLHPPLPAPDRADNRNRPARHRRLHPAVRPAADRQHRLAVPASAPNAPLPSPAHADPSSKTCPQRQTPYHTGESESQIKRTPTVTQVCG